MQQHQQPHIQGGPPGRRPAMHVPNHPNNLGQIAPVLRPNKTGLSFDVILNRLQSELNRSKETAGELHNLNSAITDIHESLNGVAVSYRTILYTLCTHGLVASTTSFPPCSSSGTPRLRPGVSSGGSGRPTGSSHRRTPSHQLLTRAAPAYPVDTLYPC